ncbi:hypothetical protein GJ496_000369 [Pomphorhynchus laevis]|nr:hypothetical protein GJ496_000369 [Pomphorhynchus laevis]
MATALLVSMILAMALGANDVGNFFGTSVGANILTMKSAFFLATIFEIVGAVLLGERVSDTIWKNVINYHVFRDEEVCLMLGNLSALIGCSIWMVIATRFSLMLIITRANRCMIHNFVPKKAAITTT